MLMSALAINMIIHTHTATWQTYQTYSVLVFVCLYVDSDQPLGAHVDGSEALLHADRHHLREDP